MGFEVVLFLALGIVAIACAIGMLISNNAVHSALFLIGNFGCVALLFLMLDAPFLSMVQIAVYAGAIMVLFLFVIMLLGAERTQDTTRQFRWLTGAATALGVSFLIAFGAPLLLSGLELPGSVGVNPLIRVVHAAQIGTVQTEGEGDALPEIAQEPVTVTIEAADSDEALVIENLQFSDVTDFIEVDEGIYSVTLSNDAGELASLQLTLAPEDVISFVAYGQADSSNPTADIGLPFNVLPLQQSRAQTDENQARVQALNIFSEAPLSLIEVGPDKALNLTTEGEVADIVRVVELPYGGQGESFDLNDGAHQLAFYPAEIESDTEPVQRLFEYNAEEGVEQLIVLVPDYDAPIQEGRYRTRVLDSTQETLPLPTREAFGNPRDIGIDLFTTYLLPVNMVGFLLLVALIGVIMLTRPTGLDAKKRRATRNRRRKVSRPLTSVISQQTGRDVVVDTPRLDNPDTTDDD